MAAKLWAVVGYVVMYSSGILCRAKFLFMARLTALADVFQSESSPHNGIMPILTFNMFALNFNFFIFRCAKVNEFIALSKNQSYLCFILVGELFGAFGN